LSPRAEAAPPSGRTQRSTVLRLAANAWRRPRDGGGYFHNR